MRIGIIIIILILISFFQLNGQNADLFVKNSFENEGSIELRFYTNDLKNKNGIDIYRKYEDGDWQKINIKPVSLKSIDQLDDSINENQKQFLELLNSDTKTDDGIISIVLILNIAKDKELAKAAGLSYIDSTSSMNAIYTYKIVDVLTKKDLAVSNKIEVSSYQAQNPPENISGHQIDNKSIALIWEPDPLAFYGVNIYKSVNGDSIEKLNNEAVLISPITNENGEEVWPEITYADKDVKIGSTYEYYIEALDYFGDAGQYSKPLKIEFKDIEPPSSPYHLFANIDDKKLKVDLSWKMDKPSDLSAYELYLISENNEDINIIDKEIISSDSNHFTFFVKSAGEYLLYLFAVDSSGNISDTSSYQIMLTDKIAPSKVENLNYEYDDGVLLIHWNHELEGDFMTYRVYQKENNAKHFKLMNSEIIDSSFFSHKLALDVKNKFQYYVISLDTNYNESERSDILEVKLPDITPPVKPFLKSVSITNDSILVNWMANVEDDLFGYNLYLIENEDTIKMNKALVHSNSYSTIKDIETENLAFCVTAVDSSGNESLYSNPYVFQNTKIITEEGSFSNFKLKSRNDSKTVSISWKFKSKIDPLGFIVYRSENDGIMKPISGMTKELKLMDTLNYEGTFYYKIVAFYESGTIVSSEIKLIKF